MIRTIFAYHAVTDGFEPAATTVTPERFAEHLRALADAGCTVDRLDAETPFSGSVAFTFDDGYDCVIERALPALARRSWNATVFVPTAHVGRSSTWDVGAVCAHRHMDWTALRDLADAGWEIGSHGVTHRALTDMNEDAAYRELVESRREIEDHIGAPVTSLSYPFGAYSWRIARLAQEAGYRRAVTMRPGAVSDPPRRFLLPRWPVYRIDRGANLIARVDGPVWVRSLESAKVRAIQSFARGTRIRMRGVTI